ncbi:BTA121 domain-containing protein surface lipoprotein [Borrelia persica]|uniref:BTA121 domain-containing protein surface lipoprotein n=1 Tax=Borrelia persica TaxID=44448 RepID=UPI0004639098|nr:hypothetical protein [Borrelia persica]
MVREQICKTFFKICILLLSLMLILGCNLRSPKTTGSSGEFSSRSGLRRPIIYKGGDRLQGGGSFPAKGERDDVQDVVGDGNVVDNLVAYDNLESVVVADELSALLDQYGIEKDKKIAIAYLKEVLCNPVFGDDVVVYDDVKFRKLFVSWQPEQVKNVFNLLFEVFNKFFTVKSLIGNIGEDAFRKGLRYRLSSFTKNYVFPLRGVFQNPLTRVYDELVVGFFGRPHIKNHDLLNDIEAVASCQTLANRYSKFSDDEQQVIRDMRSIVTDPNIAVGQGYRPYNNDDFDFVLSFWDNNQIREVVRVYLKYIDRRKSFWNSRMDTIDNVDIYSLKEALAVTKNRLSTGLRELKIKILTPNFNSKSRDSLMYLKKCFNEPIANIHYSIVSNTDSVSIDTYFENYFADIYRYLSAKESFTNKYTTFDSLKRRLVEELRDIVFDTNIVVSRDARKYNEDYEFYFLFRNDDGGVDSLISGCLAMIDLQKEISVYIDTLEKGSDVQRKCLEDYNKIIQDYKSHLKEFFCGIKEDTFELKSQIPYNVNYYMNILFALKK